MKILVLVLFLTGCAKAVINTPTATDLNKANYGKVPKDYKKRIQDYWDRTLKDPSSLKVKQITKPKKGYVLDSIEKPHGYDLYSDHIFNPIYGWTVCATYSAKNSYGGYTGFKTAKYFFNSNGKFHVLLVTNNEFLNSMHRTGDISTGVMLTTLPCK
jgi:hypothetical protein